MTNEKINQRAVEIAKLHSDYGSPDRLQALIEEAMKEARAATVAEARSASSHACCVQSHTVEEGPALTAVCRYYDIMREKLDNIAATGSWHTKDITPSS